MEISEQETGGVLVIDLKGRLDSTNALDFGNRLRTILAHAGRRLLINFENVDYISSAGFRTLLIASRQAAHSRGQMALCSLSPKVRELFELGGFIENFVIQPTREKGVAALS